MSQATENQLPVVLIAFGDDDRRQAYADLLRAQGLTIDEAADGPEALAKGISTRPALIIVETRLPGISGCDLCVLLRGDVGTRTIPIVAVGSDTYGLDTARAQEAGADAVLPYGCSPDALADEVRRVLESRAVTDADDGGRSMLPAGRASKVVHHSRGGLRRSTLKRSHHRGDTTTPPVGPPSLVCPICDRGLTYRRSHVGGVSAKHAEQWDYFDCTAGCGSFQYRLRTRKLRRVS